VDRIDIDRDTSREDLEVFIEQRDPDFQGR
jgi:hypothetical protein